MSLRSLFYVLLFLAAGCNIQSTEVGTSYVYESSGYKQCENNSSSINVSAQKLVSEGINVTSKQCGELTQTAMISVCGAPTADINILGIAQVDTDKALALGFLELSSLKKDSEDVGYIIKECL